MKALMGDWTLRDCSVPFGRVDVEDDRRDTGPRPFAVRLGSWAPWGTVPGGVKARRWLLARHPPATSVWLDHHDLFVLEDDGRLWHRRATAGMTLGAWREDDRAGSAPDWTRPASWAAVSDAADRVILFVVNEGRLLARVSDATGHWVQPWTDLAPLAPGVLFPAPVPLGPGSTVTAVPGDNTLMGSADLYLTGADGEVYLLVGWSPDAGRRPLDAGGDARAPARPGLDAERGRRVRRGAVRAGGALGPAPRLGGAGRRRLGADRRTRVRRRPVRRHRAPTPTCWSPRPGPWGR